MLPLSDRTEPRKAGPSRRAVALTAATLLAAAPASANGAMALALGTFEWGPWCIYVAATILFEALLMGRFLKVPIRMALALSILANGLTAIGGGVVSGILSYTFLGLFGSRLNPNPLGQTLLLFTLFALVSAPVEASVWLGAPFAWAKKLTRRHVLRLSFGVHLLGVPLGLAILLAPPRPYHGLEIQVAAERQVWLQHELQRALSEYMAEHRALPPDRTYEDVLRRLRPQLGPFAGDRGLWAAAYRPDYHRFDVGEMRRVPIEWNASVSNEKLDSGPTRTVWLSRSSGDGYSEGLVIELPGGVVERTTDPAKLGFR
jgi:hypothetical protein